MAVPVWPTSLPQAPQKGFQETVGVNIIRSSMDAGPAKQRRRSRRPNELNLTFIMSTTQTQTLETFINNTIFGVNRFLFTHPRLGTSAEVRIVPQDSSQLYQLQYLAPGYWTVTLKLEVLP